MIFLQLIILFLTASIASYFVGERTDGMAYFIRYYGIWIWLGIVANTARLAYHYWGCARRKQGKIIISNWETEKPVAVIYAAINYAPVLAAYLLANFGLSGQNSLFPKNMNLAGWFFFMSFFLNFGWLIYSHIRKESIQKFILKQRGPINPVVVETGVFRLP